MRSLRTTLREGVRWLAAGLLLGLVVAVLLQLFLPRSYTSAATYYVGPRVGAPATAGGDARIESYEALARSARVADDAAALLGGDPTAQQLEESVASSRRGSVIEIRVEADSPREAALRNSAVGTAFTRLVDQVERADQPVGTPVAGVQLVEPPSEPATPTWPRWQVLLPLGAGIGLLLGVVAAFARARTRRVIQRPEDLVLHLGGRVLGVLPDQRRPPRHPAPLLEPGPGAPGSRPARRAAAAHRRLRAALCTAVPGGVLVLVGAGRRQGTTTLALDVAVGLAADGRRVVLVDADRHAGPVAARLGLDPAPGFVDAAGGHVAVERAIQRWAPGGIDVVTAGTPAAPDGSTPTPAIEAAAQVLDLLRSHYDSVVVDVAGASAGGAGVALARHADGAVVVARRGTVEDDVDATVAALRLAGAPLIGGVLTRASSVPDAPAPPRTAGPPAVATPEHGDGTTGPIPPPGDATTAERATDDVTTADPAPADPAPADPAPADPAPKSDTLATPTTRRRVLRGRHAASTTFTPVAAPASAHDGPAEATAAPAGQETSGPSLTVPDVDPESADATSAGGPGPAAVAAHGATRAGRSAPPEPAPPAGRKPRRRATRPHPVTPVDDPTAAAGNGTGPS